MLNRCDLLPERWLISKMYLMELGCIGWGVDGTGSGSCAVMGFDISGVEPLCSANRELVN